MSLVVASAIALRAALLGFGDWQDANLPVKFTDIDYFVFSDAAKLVWQGASPYDRATYRYTPLLAWMLTPVAAIHPICGKLLFIVCDILVGWLLESMLTTTTRQGMSKSSAGLMVAICWSLNPFVATISSRGNAESIMAALVIGMLYLMSVSRVRWAAVVFGVAVHMKIYPIIHALPLWLAIEPGASINGGVIVRWIRGFFSWRRIEFGLISGGTFLALTGLMYQIYGHEFLEHSLLYHVTRQDHRHNFSLYFYHLYLSQDDGGRLSALMAFLPQFFLVVLLGATIRNNLPLACFAQTFAFVMLNKVVTSQYFMWYICFLPLVLRDNRLVGDKWRTGIAMLALWILGQALWLFFAYLLEHQGLPTFRYLFGAAALFAIFNSIILSSIIANQNI